MTTREKLEKVGMNWNTIIIGVPLLVGIITILRFVGPIASIPEKVEEVGQAVKVVRHDVDRVNQVQGIQTDALQRLARIAEQSQETRIDVERGKAEISEVKRRLDRLESR